MSPGCSNLAPCFEGSRGKTCPHEIGDLWQLMHLPVCIGSPVDALRGLSSRKTCLTGTSLKASMKSLPLTQMKKKYDQVEQRLLHVDSALRGRKNKQEKENGEENKIYLFGK